ncbi:MAG: hypothetical protein EPN67_08290, partial [Pusillimonas sp.]
GVEHRDPSCQPRTCRQLHLPLTPEEVGQLLRDFDGHGVKFETACAFRLMWWTLCRPIEIAAARWCARGSRSTATC